MSTLTRLPQRALEASAAVAGFALGAFVVSAIALAVLMGAWIILETVYHLVLSLIGA